MRRIRSLRLAVVLAFLLNAGSPMAWAHWLGHGHEGAQESGMTAGCHESGATALDASQPATDPSCCADGHCDCVAPALIQRIASLPRNAPPLGHPPAREDASTATPVDETLRPPIY